MEYLISFLFVLLACLSFLVAFCFREIRELMNLVRQLLDRVLVLEMRSTQNPFTQKQKDDGKLVEEK